MNGFYVVMILLGVFSKDWEGSIFQSDFRVRFLQNLIIMVFVLALQTVNLHKQCTSIAVSGALINRISNLILNINFPMTYTSLSN